MRGRGNGRLRGRRKKDRAKQEPKKGQRPHPLLDCAKDGGPTDLHHRRGHPSMCGTHYGFLSPLVSLLSFGSFSRVIAKATRKSTVAISAEATAGTTT